jgi:pimeloyl-ACP methyl ester carboxylesterase
MPSWRHVLAAVSFGTMSLPTTAAPAVPLTLTCGTYSDLHVCSGQVPSFDGAPLDVDLTLPTTVAASHPLIVMLHGFGNNKHEWESVNDEGDGADKWHWNSHWFATHGYYVLTYTARGFRDSGPGAPYQPRTPSFSSDSLPSGTIHLKSREFEGRDTMWLSSLVAAAHSDLDRHRVAVTGGSYGGGESWLLAATPTWTAGEGMPSLELQVAIPKYPWTDLGYSLAPNGHPGVQGGDPLYSSATGSPDSPTGAGAPIGVPKASYVGGFYAEGTADGTFESGTTTTPSEEGPISVPAWNARVMGTGDPYDLAGAEDPVVAQVRRGLTVFRSAYYQPGWSTQAGGHETAVFSISGWTDDLFPPVESFRMFKYLKSLDPAWPVEVATADVGHPRAQNKPSQWHRLNDQANQFLNEQINGSHGEQTTVSSMPTICGSDVPGSEVTASTPEGLAAGRMVVQYRSGGALTSTGGLADPNGPATDPVLSSQAPSAIDILSPGQGCRESTGPAVGGYTAVSDPLPHQVTMVGIGYVEVPVKFVGTTGQLDARLWDVSPSGKTTLLVSRGAYRIDVPAYDQNAETVRVPLFGNHWVFAPGHRVRIDLTQADSPMFRASSAASTIEFGPPVLNVPTRESGTTAVMGG